jgi:hypothetical protein
MGRAEAERVIKQAEARAGLVASRPVPAQR